MKLLLFVQELVNRRRNLDTLHGNPFIFMNILPARKNPVIRDKILSPGMEILPLRNIFRQSMFWIVRKNNQKFRQSLMTARQMNNGTINSSGVNHYNNKTTPLQFTGRQISYSFHSALAILELMFDIIG